VAAAREEVCKTSSNFAKPLNHLRIAFLKLCHVTSYIYLLTYLTEHQLLDVIVDQFANKWSKSTCQRDNILKLICLGDSWRQRCDSHTDH